jgi:predicted acyltransferase (DUF342 family)
VLLFSLSIVVFLAVFGLPLLPGLIEILRPSDASALAVDRRYVPIPAYFAESFRRRIAAQPRPEQAEARTPFLHRKAEYALWRQDFVVESGARQRDVVVASGRVLVNDGARLSDVVADGDLFVGNDVCARSLMSAKSLHIGSRCVVGRWAHADGDLVVGAESSAGASLTASGALSLHGDVHFTRAFGMPIRAAGRKRATGVRPVSRGAQVIPNDSTVREDLVCNGDLWIGDRCTLLGSVKARGSLVIGAECKIEGNVVSRGEIAIGPQTIVLGHVFSEEQVTIGAGSTVGTKEAYKSVYGRSRVLLDTGALIWGAIVNETGRTRLNAVTAR